LGSLKGKGRPRDYFYFPKQGFKKGRVWPQFKERVPLGPYCGPNLFFPLRKEKNLGYLGIYNQGLRKGPWGFPPKNFPFWSHLFGKPPFFKFLFHFRGFYPPKKGKRFPLLN